MDRITYTYLSLLASSLVFYHCYHRLVLWYLDQVPKVPELVTPFEQIEEIPRSLPVLQEQNPYHITPQPIIVIESIGPTMLQPFIHQMLLTL